MSPDIQVGGRVRYVDDPTSAGTVEKIYRTTADVLFDGYPDPHHRVPLRKLEPKRGRTPGTVAPDYDEPDPVRFRCVLEDVVRERLDELGMSLNQLSERAGVSRSTLGRLLAEGPGRTFVSTIEDVAKALGLSPSAFWRER